MIFRSPYYEMQVWLPTDQKDKEGRVKKRCIQFTNGVYNSDDDTVINQLKKHPDYGTMFYEGKPAANKANKTPADDSTGSNDSEDISDANKKQSKK